MDWAPCLGAKSPPRPGHSRIQGGGFGGWLWSREGHTRPVRASSTAGPLTSAFFNPALAASITFHCAGHTLLEYAQVYWLGPLTGKGRRGALGSQELPGAEARLGTASFGEGREPGHVPRQLSLL